MRWTIIKISKYTSNLTCFKLFFAENGLVLMGLFAGGKFHLGFKSRGYLLFTWSI